MSRRSLVSPDNRKTSRPGRRAILQQFTAAACFLGLSGRLPAAGVYTEAAWASFRSGPEQRGLARGSVVRVRTVNRVLGDPTATQNGTPLTYSCAGTLTFKPTSPGKKSVTVSTVGGMQIAADGCTASSGALPFSCSNSFTVTANVGTGAGTLGLNQTGPGTVSPALSGTFTGEVYTTPPTVVTAITCATAAVSLRA